MELSLHIATEADLPLLAEWNHQLIRDEGHRNSMTVAALEERMRHWLQGEYRAVGLRLTVDVLCRNEAAVGFWRSVGYRDYCLTLEIMPL